MVRDAAARSLVVRDQSVAGPGHERVRRVKVDRRDDGVEVVGVGEGARAAVDVDGLDTVSAQRELVPEQGAAVDRVEHQQVHATR